MKFAEGLKSLDRGECHFAHWTPTWRRHGRHVCGASWSRRHCPVRHDDDAFLFSTCNLSTAVTFWPHSQHFQQVSHVTFKLLVPISPLAVNPISLMPLILICCWIDNLGSHVEKDGELWRVSWPCSPMLPSSSRQERRPTHQRRDEPYPAVLYDLRSNWGRV